ncbi:TraR/DksA family transcriptional regulator [Tsuneonella mangrovi]|uniref:TraR/DksA family transcriptional regulator n=1 Tax=Tsuneonella mangrovi TaxID=1982042 RepID=UPI000BA275C2|nr:TraR/DksA family transcriptional regulator [Tsuneonella mangrovi]
MDNFDDLREQLEARLAELLERADEIEDDLRHPLEADSADQAIDLEDDDALAGTDDVLRNEITQIRAAMSRIANGSYGFCAVCGKPIDRKRLEARPIATRCIEHAR